MAQAGLQMFLGMEDHLTVIDLHMTELLTDDMAGITGRRMDIHILIHILDGRRIPRQGHRHSFAWSN